ncbi:hypothetical protein ACF3NG_09285 [Aerococcaceae bacterium WGS1372]
MGQLHKYSISILTILLLILVQSEQVIVNANINKLNNDSVTASDLYIIDDTTKTIIHSNESIETLSTDENQSIETGTPITISTVESTADTAQTNQATYTDLITIVQSIPSTLTSLANNLPNEEYSMPWNTYNSLTAHERAQIILDTFLTERSRFDNLTNELVLSEDQTALQDNGDEVNFTNYYWSVINETTLELYNSEKEHSSYLIQDKDLGLVYLVDFTESEQSTDEQVILEVNIIEYHFAPYN